MLFFLNRYIHYSNYLCFLLFLIIFLKTFLPYLNTGSGKSLECILKTLSSTVELQDEEVKEAFISSKDFILEAMEAPIQSTTIGVRKETVSFLAKCCTLWGCDPETDPSFASYKIQQRCIIARYMK